MIKIKCLAKETHKPYLSPPQPHCPVAHYLSAEIRVQHKERNLSFFFRLLPFCFCRRILRGPQKYYINVTEFYINIT
jgi:hypothetical protein